MVGNKFATILHRRTHRMIFLLIYAALEWILLTLLLLNALFSFLIAKFASLFGLSPPCIFCSRIDHLFEPSNGRISYRNLLCEAHAREISILGFCSIHRRLADGGYMCEDCAAARRGETDRSGTALLSWMNRGEHGEKNLLCSCCGVVLESGIYSPFVLLKPAMAEGKEGDKGEDGRDLVLLPSTRAPVEDASLEIVGLPAEKPLDEPRLLPIALIDSFTAMIINPQPAIKVQAQKESVKESKNDEANFEISIRNETYGNEQGAMAEGEKMPNSIECFPPLDDRIESERREFGAESIDGSIASEIDSMEPLTIDRLKAALRAERKALSALYSDLEEERSASAVAANQTMAMITRLQEEKAAMQMEALQYQRMMEEQSEYDQEALQLLNEVMLKREKEKRDLEKELEFYKEKVRKEEDEKDGAKHLTTMDESLAEFEERRLSILDQVNALEEKLLKIEHFSDENGHGIIDGLVNGCSDDPKTNGRLLPVLDEEEEEKLRLAEEVDHVYERLQALETDLEFLKHCGSSMKKGDKGMGLLQEVLQHLRDLRAVELHSRHSTTV